MRKGFHEKLIGLFKSGPGFVDEEKEVFFRSFDTERNFHKLVFRPAENRIIEFSRYVVWEIFKCQNQLLLQAW